MTSKRDKLRQDIRDAKQTTSKTKVGGKFAEPQHSAYIIPATLPEFVPEELIRDSHYPSDLVPPFWIDVIGEVPFPYRYTIGTYEPMKIWLRKTGPADPRGLVYECIGCGMTLNRRYEGKAKKTSTYRCGNVLCEFTKYLKGRMLVYYPARSLDTCVAHGPDHTHNWHKCSFCGSVQLLDNVAALAQAHSGRCLCNRLYDHETGLKRAKEAIRRREFEVYSKRSRQNLKKYGPQAELTLPLTMRTYEGFCEHIPLMPDFHKQLCLTNTQHTPMNNKNLTWQPFEVIRK